MSMTLHTYRQRQQQLVVGQIGHKATRHKQLYIEICIELYSIHKAETWFVHRSPHKQHTTHTDLIVGWMHRKRWLAVAAFDRRPLLPDHRAHSELVASERHRLAASTRPIHHELKIKIEIARLERPKQILHWIRRTAITGTRALMILFFVLSAI